ncbi:MAG: TetR family transcriptional regulator [Mycobacteriaceae bacterium]|jgi:AcrR family transcriptional regulator
MSTTRTRVPYHEAARQLLRDSVLDGARELLTTKPWSEITMAEVAATAGMSRQTLYKEFRSRQGLAAGYLLRLVDQFLDSVEAEVSAHPGDARGAIASAFGVFFAEGTQDPMVLNLVGPRPQHDLLSLVTTEGQPILERATERLTEIFVGSWANVSHHDAAIFSACIVRLGISHMTLTPGDPRRAAADLGELFGPFLDQAIRVEARP